MRVIIDMNLSRSWAGFLKSNNIDAAHWSEIGPVDALDEFIMRHAADQHAVVLTNDLDFGAILAATGGKAPSVVQIRAADLRVAAIGKQVAAALQQSAELLAAGALLTVEPARARITALPIGDER
jgi:predicted nuclease of predicted toxin-antitoxin system